MVRGSQGLLSPPSFRGDGEFILRNPNLFRMIFLLVRLVLQVLPVVRRLALRLFEVALAFVFPILGIVDRLYFSRLVLSEEDV